MISKGGIVAFTMEKLSTLLEYGWQEYAFIYFLIFESKKLAK